MVALFILAIIVGFLLLELVVGKFEGRHMVVEHQAAPVGAPPPTPADVLFHRGHTWARSLDDGTVRVGMDEFSRTIAGTPDEIKLPPAGSRIVQGERAWSVRRGDREIPMLAPIDGEVVELNEHPAGEPEGVATSTYGDGWLMRVRPSNYGADSRNLLAGPVVKRWLDDAYEQLSGYFTPELGAVLADGGELVQGVLDAIPPERVDDAISTFFLAEAPSIDKEQ